MAIEETATRARQGGKGRDILVILIVSTLAAVLLVWGIFALWATDNANVNDTSVTRGEAAATDFTAEETIDVNPNAQDGAPVETNPGDPDVLQSDDPNPVAPAGGLN